jgi:hypothetical protein
LFSLVIFLSMVLSLTSSMMLVMSQERNVHVNFAAAYDIAP